MTSGLAPQRAANAITGCERSAPPEPEPARSWLLRAEGECAYPVAGEGASILSCCRPAARGGYCPFHRRIMFRPADPKEAREILRLVKALEARAADAEGRR